ncbi:hypothetical protein [Pseudonocardia sp.]|uniref:hypothetical protein n=1 Tax=Pseudonocardia sp. TaxID=60912 RepID=UPI00260B96E4|nr:hypothetical protein [Pseudonocardia sp.]
MPPLMNRILQYLPRGNTLDDEAWAHRHHIVVVVLAMHLPLLLAFSLVLDAEALIFAQASVVPAACLVGARLVKSRRPVSIIATAGLTWCSARGTSKSVRLA